MLLGTDDEGRGDGCLVMEVVLCWISLEGSLGRSLYLASRRILIVLALLGEVVLLSEGVCLVAWLLLMRLQRHFVSVVVRSLEAWSP